MCQQFWQSWHLVIMLHLNKFSVEADEVVTVNLSMLYESFKH